MNQSILTRSREVAIHLGFWILAAYFAFVGNPFYFSIASPDLFYSTYLIVFIATFYVNYALVMKRVFAAFGWLRLLAGLAVSFLFFAGFRFVVEQLVTQALFRQVNYIDPTFWNYLADNLVYSSKPIILSALLWLMIHVIRLLDHNKRIREEQRNTEIKFLKAQLNPHFIFNTLNNIYSMVHFQSPEALPAIEKLSSIMRFTTYEVQRNRIGLAEELNYIHAYIELEQLRHYDRSFVAWTLDLEDERAQIPPCTLSPLVENALKHGSYSQEAPVEIRLHCDAQSLRFEVKNKIGKQKKDATGGIGLDNLRNRLELLYPGKHRLGCVEKENYFFASLDIQFT